MPTRISGSTRTGARSACDSCSGSSTTPARAGACVFPLHDPERAPAYRLPNDRVLAWAGKARDDCCLSAASTRPKIRSRRASAASRPARAGIKLHPRAQAFGFASPEMDGIFALAESAAVPILIHAGRGLPPLGGWARRSHPAPPRWRADPRPRGDLRSGHHHLAPGRSPGGALRHLLLLPARRDRAARARPNRAHRVRLRPALRPACHHPLHGAARRRAGRPRRGRGAGAARRHDRRTVRRPRAAVGHRSAARTLDHALRSARAGVRIWQPRRPRDVHGTDEQAQAMLEMALAACRDPDPGDVGAALETIEAALTAAGALLWRRPRTASARRSISSTARSCAPPPSCPTAPQPRASQTAAHSPRSRRSRSRIPRLSPNAPTTSSTCSLSKPPASR